jgi:hypothetical protein
LAPQIPAAQWLAVPHGAPLGEPFVQVPPAHQEPAPQSRSAAQPAWQAPVLHTPERQSAPEPQGLPEGPPQSPATQTLERQAEAAPHGPPLGSLQSPSTGEQEPLRHERASAQEVPPVAPHLPSAPQTPARHSLSPVQGIPGPLPQRWLWASHTPERHSALAVQPRSLGSPQRPSASQTPAAQRDCVETLQAPPGTGWPLGVLATQAPVWRPPPLHQ